MERVRHTLPLFCNHLLFCNHFGELQPVLFEVELIMNNAPLTYVYPNTIETCLKPNYLLFGILQRVIIFFQHNPTVLSNATDKVNRISNHFRDR